jgi:hypothetical protein
MDQGSELTSELWRSYGWMASTLPGILCTSEDYVLQHRTVHHYGSPVGALIAYRPGATVNVPAPCGRGAHASRVSAGMQRTKCQR